MTIEKAIEQLLPMVIRNFKQPSPDECDAIKLGIEALKRVEAQDQNRTLSQRWLLPGETKE